MRGRIYKNTVGFTLIEMMVAITLGMVVIAGATGTFIAQTRQNAAEEQISQMHQNVRGALDLMVREIQMAKYDPKKCDLPTCNPAVTAFPALVYGVTYSASQLEIKSDVLPLSNDGDGTIDTSSGSVEDIIYVLANNQITRKLGSSGPAEIVADNITSFNFNYYDANGSAVTSLANSGLIRKVSITITGQTAKIDPSYPGGYRTYSVTADVTPPNLAL
jgi:type IV pilus assembly protein PilW